MKRIEKLKSRPVTDKELFDKVNEIVDAINSLSRNDEIYASEKPGAYDLNAVGQFLKRKKKQS